MTATKPKREPSDLIPAWQAAQIAQTTTTTLRRWADDGRLSSYERDGFKRSARFYSKSEVEGLAPRAR